MSVSMGAEQHERMFLKKKRRLDRVRSASRPRVNVVVASARPIIVRYWKCQP